MKNTYYGLSQAEFATILQDMRGRGTNVSHRMTQLGLLYMVTDEERDTYHLFYMTHDETAFVCEYLYHLEVLTFISGNINGLLSVFPWIKATQSK